VTHVLSAFVAQLGTHGALEERDREAIFALPVTVESYVSETRIARQGDVGSTFLVLIEGFAFRQKHTGSGARQIFSLNAPGDSLNLPALFLSCADHDVLALPNAKIAVIPSAPVIDLVSASPPITRAFFKSALVDASIGREWLLNLGQRDARTRVAHFLCEHLARMEERGLAVGGVFDLPLTQERLGEATGLTAVHTSRTLRKLKDEGLILQKGRSFTIPSISALREAGDFQAQYLFQ
jgi:CRP-like cAMP-binding protein